MSARLDFPLEIMAIILGTGAVEASISSDTVIGESFRLTGDPFRVFPEIVPIHGERPIGIGGGIYTVHRGV